MQNFAASIIRARMRHKLRHTGINLPRTGTRNAHDAHASTRNAHRTHRTQRTHRASHTRQRTHMAASRSSLTRAHAEVGHRTNVVTQRSYGMARATRTRVGVTRVLLPRARARTHASQATGILQRACACAFMALPSGQTRALYTCPWGFITSIPRNNNSSKQRKQHDVVRRWCRSVLTTRRCMRSG